MSYEGLIITRKRAKPLFSQNAKEYIAWGKKKLEIEKFHLFFWAGTYQIRIAWISDI